MLPIKIEPLEKLRKRYLAALNKIWDGSEYPDRPGLHYEHIFDFERGLRLLISKDKFEDLEPHIHISASWFKNPPNSLEEMNNIVISSFKSLGGLENLVYIGMSNRGIPHWITVKLN